MGVGAAVRDAQCHDHKKILRGLVPEDIRRFLMAHRDCVVSVRVRRRKRVLQSVVAGAEQFVRRTA